MRRTSISRNSGLVTGPTRRLRGGRCFTVEPGRWNTARSFLFDSDLGITLEGIVVALVGVAFVMAAVAEALTHSTWNALLVVGGAVFIIVGAALAFIAWVNRSEP